MRRAFTLAILLCIFLTLETVEACTVDSDCTGTGTGTCSSGTCVCTTGSYLSGGSCAACGTDRTTSGTGSTSESDCVCTAGHYDVGGTCTDCADGTYKAAIGDGECTSCGNSGTTGGNTGSEAATDCVCAAGYYLDTGSTPVCVQISTPICDVG